MMSKKIGGKIKRWRGNFRVASLFDTDFYLSTNPDVVVNGADPLEHYMIHGWREGRDPSRSFSTLFYKDKYLGVDNKEINPLQHFSNLPPSQRKNFLTHSNSEFLTVQKHIIGPYFDPRFYVNTYKLKFVSDPLTHYLINGWRHGFEPNEDFDSHDHLIRHSHLINGDLCPFYHFISTYNLLGNERPLVRLNFDYDEARASETKLDVILEAISHDFDATYYLSGYTDVREAGVDPLFHFAQYGHKEGRNPSETFWTTYYKETYRAELDLGANPLYHYVTEGRARGFKPNPIGTRLWPTLIAPSADEWTKAVPAANVALAEVVVIIPVYKGYDETLRAIHSVLAHQQASRFALLVINDCGPEPRLNDALISLANLGYFFYVHNENNLGFVASVNRALDLSAGKDVILLNSDAVPYGDWIDRMLWHARAHKDVATITPMSNNATICSYPQLNHNNKFQLEIYPEQIDAYARSCNHRMSSDLPTGVGFCFFIRRTVLDVIGVFDAETFGRGYGEECDLCMRAQKAGYRNLMAHDIFVYHAGGVSFGSTYANNLPNIERRLLRKHPDYTSQVYQYIAADPGKEARIRLDLYRIAKHLGSRTAVYISHGLSGGIDTHIRDASARLDDEEVELITLKVSGPRTLKLEFSRFTTRALTTFSFNEFYIDKHAHLISAFLEWLNPLFVHIHSFVGLDWESTKCLMRIMKEQKRYYYTLHDYSPVCHRNNLVTPLARYCGLPGPDTCRQCIAIDHQSRAVVDPAMRRQVFSRFLADATTVFSPSADIAERLRPHIPGAKIVIRPHEEVLPAVHRPASPASVRRRENKDPSPVLLIAAVGAIGPHKGSRVIHDLALDARIRGLPIEYRIIGYSDITDRLAAVGVSETGPYETDSEAMDMLRILGADLVLIPSVWPETYCYALSLALAAGIPPVIFDLGAQAERLRASDEGLRLNPDLIDDPTELNNLLLSSSIEEIYNRRKHYKIYSYTSLLQEYYEIV